jgi:hypothetical protein
MSEFQDLLTRELRSLTCYEHISWGLAEHATSRISCP